MELKEDTKKNKDKWKNVYNKLETKKEACLPQVC